MRHSQYFLLSLLLVLITHARGQIDSTRDMFPLVEGNEWTYSLHASFYNMDDVSFNTQGTVNATVVGRTAEGDSTKWRVREIDSVKHCWGSIYPPAYDTCSIRIDTSYFDIVELHQGLHRLYRPETEEMVRNSVFPFAVDLTNPRIITRYQAADSSSDTTRITTEPAPAACNRYAFTFVRGVGEVASLCTTMCVGNTGSRELRLLSATVFLTARDRNFAPRVFTLEQNYPNPFNPATTIRYSIPAMQHVRVGIYDVLGREIALPVDERKPAGEYLLRWDAGNLPSGVYYYRLAAGSSAETKKMLLVR